MHAAAFAAPLAVPLSPGCATPRAPRRPPLAAATVARPQARPNIPVVDVFTHYPPRSTHRRAPPPPVLIVPGFGADAEEYFPMADHLRGHLPDTFVHVVPLSKAVWLSALGGRPVTKILQHIDDAVQHALQHTGSTHVSLVAHSAGGWISRIYLGDHPYPQGDGPTWGGNRVVKTLLCLGTPHRSDENVTLQNMAFVNDSYPDAFHDHVQYVNFAGDGGSVSDAQHSWWKFWHKDWFPSLSYRLTDRRARQGPVAGDGIVPLSVAFLKDAEHNVCLKGVWHSPAAGRPWYGHPRVVEYWSTFLR